jgi:hypothetical protein
MAATSVKAIRCSEDDIERNRLLRLHRNEDESESELMLVAMRLGLRVLAAQARTNKDGQYGGYDPVELAQRLRIDLLPVLDFLTEMDELPRIFFRAAPPIKDADSAVVEESPAPAVAAEATGAILAFSGGFLDDDD